MHTNFIKAMFVVLCCFGQIHAQNTDLLIIKNVVPALGATAIGGYGIYRAGLWMYNNETMARFGNKWGGKAVGFTIAAACGGLIVKGIEGKGAVVLADDSTSPAQREQLSAGTRLGSGILGLASLFLAWRYLTFARPGIKLCAAMCAGVTCVTGIGLGGRCLATPLWPVDEKFLGKEFSDSHPMFKVAVGLAMIVVGAACGITSYQYYWRMAGA